MAARSKASKANIYSFTNPQQMSLDDYLDSNIGELIQLPIDPDDVGGALVSILTKGLYTNPLDCIREYVQNSVDAKALDVIIKITGNSVTIYDDGTGMDLSRMLQARQFGMSEKLLTESVGFRGIGIYSGFDLCRRLRITSTKEGDNHQHVIVFEFEAMKTILESEKSFGPGQKKTSIIKLLSEHTYIKRERTSGAINQHFTVVDLQEISDTHIKALSNRTELRSYLLRNLPVDFAPSFEHKKVINQNLADHVPGYTAIKITLQSDGLADEVVTKPAIPHLQTPTFGYITSSGHQIAYYWACLNEKSQRINHNLKDEGLSFDPSYEGFVYKVRGFTIGDRDKLRPMFGTRTQLYPWYTGEIFVIDANIIPNAARDDFETNQAKKALEIALTAEFGEKGKLVDIVERFQAQSVADRRIIKAIQELADIELQINSNTQSDDYKTFSRLEEMTKEIKAQKSKATTENKVSAEEILDRATKLQKQLRREAENPISETTKRKRAAHTKSIDILQPVPVIKPLPLPAASSIQSILKEQGWEFEGKIGSILDMIQESIEEVLGSTSVTYSALINTIEAKINTASDVE